MENYIEIKGAKEHNLKNINVKIPKNQFVVITGLSGSGKSSLAFDTIYAEGQRRYVESLSAYARQFLQMQDKPEVDSISGLSPAIAIDQKTTSKNPRSTVGTITEIYDYLRLLYARIGVPYSPATGLPITSQTSTEMVDQIIKIPNGTKIALSAPIARAEKGEFRKEMINLRKAGYQRIKIDGEMHDLDNPPSLEKQKKHTIEVIIDRILISEEMGNRLADSIETALKLGDGLLVVDIIELPKNHKTEYKDSQRMVYSEKYACPESGFQITDLEPRMFSFNSPYGACQVCEGIGKDKKFDPDLIVPNQSLSINQGAIGPWKYNTSKSVFETLNAVADFYGFSLDQSFESLKEEHKNILFYGSGDQEIEFSYYDGYKKLKISQPFGGIIPSLESKLKRMNSNLIRDDLSKYLSDKKCNSCSGYRLKQESLCVKIDNVHIGEVCNKTIIDCHNWCEKMQKSLPDKSKKISEKILKEIKERLKFLKNVGLEYLTLSRPSGTLSGGEGQRIRLASQIGSGLTGVLYVLDEPSIGLHQRDNSKLIDTLKNLRDVGNTVIVVEHDEETMHAADHIIDIGPGAGTHGGQIIAAGNIDEIKSNSNSITGMYLSGNKMINLPENYRKLEDKKCLTLKGATANNLKNVDISIPLGCFTSVTGVSGSGKSSLIIHTLYKALIKKIDSSKVTPGEYESISGIGYIDKVIDIDQSPIGRTPRSNPATYTGLFNHIRDWFAALPESRARGYKISRFSFNVKGGRCEACQGDGMMKIEMHFLPDVYVQCDACKGLRYNRETLEIKYKGKSISDILSMNVDDCAEFFSNVPLIKDKLKTLSEVGLNYLKIGQSATTLSGGEAQRIKLAKELSKRSTGRTFYILDEPTTGLHAEDINKLLKVLHKLVEKGNTVLVIEHNLDVIKTSDYIIDVGPEGGDSGGKIVVSGPVNKVTACKESHTGQFLKTHIKNYH